MTARYLIVTKKFAYEIEEAADRFWVRKVNTLDYNGVVIGFTDHRGELSERQPWSIIRDMVVKGAGKARRMQWIAAGYDEQLRLHGLDQIDESLVIVTPPIEGIIPQRERDIDPMNRSGAFKRPVAIPRKTT